MRKTNFRGNPRPLKSERRYCRSVILSIRSLASSLKFGSRSPTASVPAIITSHQRLKSLVMTFSVSARTRAGGGQAACPQLRPQLTGLPESRYPRSLPGRPSATCHVTISCSSAAPVRLPPARAQDRITRSQIVRPTRQA